MFMLPLLAVVGDAWGILMGWVATTMAEPIALTRFVDLGFRRVAFSDFLPSTLKTIAFGWIIGVVACFQGMRATRGTRGVGLAATSSVVIASLFIILADVVLVRLILFLFPV
jgi:phospholipid/cholesterol/gamma-HCH transport system permease protein